MNIDELNFSELSPEFVEYIESIDNKFNSGILKKEIFILPEIYKFSDIISKYLLKDRDILKIDSDFHYLVENYDTGIPISCKCIIPELLHTMHFFRDCNQLVECVVFFNSTGYVGNDAGPSILLFDYVNYIKDSDPTFEKYARHLFTRDGKIVTSEQDLNEIHFELITKPNIDKF